MMLRYTLIIATFFATPLMSVGQNAITEYNNGQVRARIHSGGRIGANQFSGTGGYFIPAGGNTSPLYSSGLWFGGTTSDGQQRAFGHLYGTPQYFSTGPLTMGSATLDPATATAYDRFWTVTSSQVNNHIAYNECILDPGCDVDTLFPSGYTVPPSFLQWPAMGNVDAGQAAYLAPFIDFDGDGAYDPIAGDHPCIPGDLAIYHIFNDQGVAQASGSGMGLEVHMTTFGYSGTNGLEVGRTLFTRYRIINRSSATYTNFRIGAFADFDLGCYSDDRIGTDVGRNLFFVNNANDVDVSCQSTGYGEQPPAFGIQVLEGPLMDPDGTDNSDQPIIPAFNGSGFDDGITDNERYGLSGSMYFNNSFPGSNDPTTSAHFYNYLRGTWADGSSLSYGGTGYGGGTVSAFAFPGDTDPNGVGTNAVPQVAWSDAMASDQKGVAIMGPITLEPGEEQEILLAYVYGRASTGGVQESVLALQQASDAVTTFAENTAGLLLPGLACASFSTGFQERSAFDRSLQLYPNPTNDLLNIGTGEGQQPADVHIMDAHGAVVVQALRHTSDTPLHVGRLAPGIYTVRWVAPTGVRMGRFVKQ